jgi:hypothetical protein
VDTYYNTFVNEFPTVTFFSCMSVSVETQKELQLIERNVKDETSTSEDEDASPDIGHDICLETYSGLLTYA